MGNIDQVDEHSTLCLSTEVLGRNKIEEGSSQWRINFRNEGRQTAQVAQ